MFLHSRWCRSPGGGQGVGWGLGNILLWGATDSLPTRLLLTSGQGFKSKPVLGWRSRRWIQCSCVWNSHGASWPPPPQEEARPRQKNSCNPKQGSLERRAKSTSLEITGLWGLREVRKDEECSLPKPLATHVLNSTLLLSSMKILNGPTYPPWESSYPHKSLPAQSDQMCAMYTRRTISLLLFAASLF